jgi:hypothetical protein
MAVIYILKLRWLSLQWQWPRISQRRKRMLRSPWLVLALVWTLAAPAHAQSEALFVKRASELRQGPSETTAVVVALPAQTAVTRLPERQGPWMRVKTEAGQTGWVHMFDVGTVAAPSTLGSAASGALRGLGNFFNRSSTVTTAPTSTVGIRGLGAEDIANAQPNMQALQQAEGLRADAAQAKRFATDAQWVARTVEPLPMPQPPASPEATGRQGGAK